ncbi:SNARE associated Golgi-related protein [[Leptolyngbya] sp. PCC 7376]|uniref:DedA family protein n=1 Tax=[Leptolyngbya] sp. PCC 7376 TaxID=111781 RepID=UPI00029EE9A1|nr:DedA family protein [[Leptolyngbya] sp. PCC 7376]AFY37946.1 SNARE associated Golgi-related protein [[Leptolyngbya] sp. PCC 7376]
MTLDFVIDFVTNFFTLESLQLFIHDYGYWSVFVGIGLENTGIPIPGEALTLLGGFLAGSGELKYQWVLLGAIAGSFLGNSIGYFIGKWGGLPLLRKIAHVFRISDQKIDEAREKFLENAPKAVFFGRFVTFFRIFAAPLAGIVEMPFALFLTCNLAGAVVWAGVTVTLPYFLGQFLPLPEVLDIMGKFGIGIVGLLVAWVIVSIFLERRQSTT